MSYTAKNVPNPRFESVCRWIHETPASGGLETMIADHVSNAQSSGLPALEVCESQSGRRVAAAYFHLLPGSVATLGGVRYNQGLKHVATKAINELVRTAKSQGIAQIQAIVSDATTRAVVEEAEFVQLTRVKHMWKTVKPIRDESRIGPANGRNASRLNWRPANDLALDRLAKLLSETFVGSLDCPALNGLRTPAQMLQGFLNDRHLRQIDTWEVATYQGQDIGCLFIEQHPQQVAEIAYMGIVAPFRKLRLGRDILKRSDSIAQRLHCTVVVVAVDENNLPALKLYRRDRFDDHQTLEVWLHPPANPNS